MKRNSVRIGVAAAIVGLAALTGWQIHRGRTIRDAAADDTVAHAAADDQNSFATPLIRDADSSDADSARPTLLAPASYYPASSDLADRPEGDAAGPMDAPSDDVTPSDESKPAVGDRYASEVADDFESAATAPETEDDSPTVTAEAAAMEIEEELVARGQNAARSALDTLSAPNPLRGGGSGNIGPPPGSTGPSPASPPSQSGRARQKPGTLPADMPNAVPLVPDTPARVQAAAHSDRYGSGAAIPGAAVGFGRQDDSAQAANGPPPSDLREPAPLRSSPLDVGPPIKPQPLVSPPAEDARDFRNIGTPQPESYGATNYGSHSRAGGAGAGAGRPGEQSLEGPQSPSLVIEKIAPEEIQVGKQCTFEIRVRNAGQSTAHQVRVFDEVPEGTEFVGAAPQANQNGPGRLVWDLGTLAPGEEQTVEVQLMPTEEGDIGSVATVTFAGEASVRVRCTRPLLELRTTAGRQVMIGDEHLVSVEIHNPGSGDATGVMLLENIPAGVSHPAGKSLEFEIGTLRAGETRKLDLALTAEQAGIVDNRLVARGDANLEAESTAQFEVIAPNLHVSIEGPRKRYLERQATYSVALDNPGTASAKDIELVTELPDGMKFVRANNLGEYDEASHSVHWSLAELPPNERGVVELVMLPTTAGEQRLQVKTRASQGLADTTEHAVLVEGLAAIMFEVVDVEDPIEVGGETSYEIRVVNQGSKIATNLQVAAILPPGMTATSAAGPTQYQIGQGQVVFAPLARLAPKADTTYRINVQGLQPGDKRFRVQVLTSEVEQPITKEESTRVYADE